MDPLTLSLLVVAGLVLLFLIGVPVGYAMGIAGFLGMLAFYDVNQALVFIARRIHDYLASFTFTAVPLFILMGYFALRAGFTRDAFSAARLWVARAPGGLASATVLASAMFAACSGSGLPAAAALGRVAVPEMTNVGYDRRLAAGVVAAATPLAVLIPPSIVMIIFGVVTGASIGRLLIAGIVPGILSIAVFIAGITLLAWFRPHLAPKLDILVSWRMRFASLRSLWGIGALFACVIGSIYAGWATPTEAAAIGASGALALGLATRRITYADIKIALYDTAILSAALFLIIVMASVFMIFVVRSGAVSSVASFVVSLNLGVIELMILLSIIYIILGMFLDSVSMIVLTMPVILPILVAMDIDLVWFGIVMIIWVEIAAITPPFGISVYAVKGALGDSMELWDIFTGAFFFVLLWIIILALIIGFPSISLWLPNLMRG